MMSKREAIREAARRYGKGAFLAIRHTLVAEHRRAVGVTLPDQTRVELGRGRSWEAALAAAELEISKAQQMARSNPP